MSLEDVVFLHPVEAVSLDAGALQSLELSSIAVAQPSAADDLFEDFIVCLSSVEVARATGAFDRLGSQATMLAVLSDNLGLDQSAAVARRPTSLVGTPDEVAQAAVSARAICLGEASLTSILEIACRRI